MAERHRNATAKRNIETQRGKRAMGVFEYSVRHLLGAQYRGGGVAFTPAGTALVVAVGARLVVVDLVAGRTRTLAFEATRDLVAVSPSPAGAVLTLDQAGRAALVALATGRVRARLTLRLPSVVTARLSPCGLYAAFAGADATEVWKLPKDAVPEYAAFEKLMRFPAGAAGPGCLEWSPDSTRLAVGSRDGLCRIFTLPCFPRVPGTRVRPVTLYGHREAMSRVIFCGKRGLITMSRDGVLFCWRLRFMDERPGFYNVGSAACEAGSGGSDDDGDALAKNVDAAGQLEGRQTWLVPVEAKLLSRHFVKQGGAKRVRSAAVHGGMLTVGMSNGVFALYQLPTEMAEKESQAFDEGLFHVGDLRKRKRRGDLRREGTNGDASDTPTSVGDEADGDEDDGIDELDQEIPRIKFSELSLLHTLSASAGALTNVQFNATGEWIVLASAHSGQLVVWEWRSETHVLKQQAHVLAASSLAFSPDGRALATGSRDGRVKLWGVATGFCAATFSDHSAAVTSIAFAANDVIVSASLDGTVRAFDIRRYRNFRILVGPPPRRQFGCVAVDSAGDLVAAGCVDTFEVIVWSLRTGQVLELLAGHKGPVSSIAFRPRRGTLASASWDRTVRLWDMYERKGSCETLEHSKEVLSVSFRPDGKEFAACTMSGEVVLWDAEQATITGTIDGSRDSAPGRARDSRTVAQQRGHFQSLSYSADGRFLLAGAASKHVCVYNVGDGRSPSLIDRVVMTENQNFDGLLDQLNSRNQTVSGLVTDVLDDDDEGAESYGEAIIAAGRSQPGASSEQQTRRKKLLKAEVKCVHFCPTGRLWAAVTSEGVLVYGEGRDGLGADGGGVLFDPTDLAVDVTPDAALAAAAEQDYEKSLVIALRLNEQTVLNSVVEMVPPENVSLVVSRLPTLYFTRLTLLFAWRLENNPHLDFNLSWSRRLLLSHGGHAHRTSTDPSAVNTALRTLHRACSSHSKRLMPLADRNQHTLEYLITLAANNRLMQGEGDN